MLRKIRVVEERIAEFWVEADDRSEAFFLGEEFSREELHDSNEIKVRVSVTNEVCANNKGPLEPHATVYLRDGVTFTDKEGMLS